MRFYTLAALLLLGPSLCIAQADVAASCLLDPTAAVAPLAIRPAASAQFAVVQDCITSGDGDCAEAALEEIDDSDLNADELAVLTLARGDTEQLQGSSRRARREYGRVLDIDDVDRQLASAAIKRLAIRHLEDERYDDALERLEDLECGEWTPDFLYLQAQAQYGDSDFESAQASVEAAIIAQEAADGNPPGEWFGLHENAVQATSEEIICERVTLPSSNIPQRVCTTRTQREEDREDAREFQRTHGDPRDVIFGE